VAGGCAQAELRLVRIDAVRIVSVKFVRRKQTFGKTMVWGFLAEVVLTSILWVPRVMQGSTIASNVSIAANAEISAAGNAGLPQPSAGAAPVQLALPSNPSVLTVLSVTGTISLNQGSGIGSNDLCGASKKARLRKEVPV
jgi:hypothetical protein